MKEREPWETKITWERAVRGYGRRIEEDCDLGFMGERETNTFVGLAVSI